MLTKEEIRRAVREERGGLDAEWVRNASLTAQRLTVELPEFRDASVVGCYMAMATEVQTELVIEQAHMNGKTLCVPAQCPETKTYRLAVVREDSAMVAGYMGIMEPDRKEWIPVTDVDCVVVAGLGFDAAGGRVGYGGGNYDRILAPVAEVAACFRVGLAFEFQLFDRVPVNDTDVLMDVVVTEMKTMRKDKGGTQ